MSKSIILVTGSSGFCGGVLIPKLKNLGYKTIGIDCLPGPYTDIVQDINSPIKIADDIDQKYYLTFNKALKSGVKILCYDCKLSNKEIKLNNQIFYDH